MKCIQQLAAYFAERGMLSDSEIAQLEAGGFYKPEPELPVVDVSKSPSMKDARGTHDWYDLMIAVPEPVCFRDGSVVYLDGVAGSHRLSAVALQRVQSCVYTSHSYVFFKLKGEV